MILLKVLSSTGLTTTLKMGARHFCQKLTEVNEEDRKHIVNGHTCNGHCTGKCFLLQNDIQLFYITSSQISSSDQGARNVPTTIADLYGRREDVVLSFSFETFLSFDTFGEISLYILRS